MAKSSTHTRKRQYQPSNQTHLGSYFNRDAAWQRQRQRQQSPTSPPLDANTAASLLSVGMRVRKSVPEGYKTHKTLGSAGFPFSASAQPQSSAPVRPSYNPMQTRELTPFCGLHKIGGYLLQEVPPSSAPADMQTSEQGEDHYDLPALSMSQQTIMSTQNSFASSPHSKTESRKRTYEDEMDDDMDAFFDEQDDADVMMPCQNASIRPIAKLKGRSSRPHQDAIGLFGSDDFEDASFLMPMEVQQ